MCADCKTTKQMKNEEMSADDVAGDPGASPRFVLPGTWILFTLAAERLFNSCASCIYEIEKRERAPTRTQEIEIEFSTSNRFLAQPSLFLFNPDPFSTAIVHSFSKVQVSFIVLTVQEGGTKKQSS